MTIKIDKRKVRTKLRFRKALLNLLKECKFEEITLTEISKQAEVNRVTFYGHYHDKYELLEDVIDTTLQGYREFVISSSKKECLHSDQEFPIIMAMLSYIQDQSLFFTTMLSERRVPGFIPLFVGCIEGIYQQLLLINSGKIDSEIYRKYITSATLGLISNWIKTDMKDSPEFLIEQLKTIQKQSLQKYLLLNQLNVSKVETFRGEDRRIQRTRQNLTYAFLLLIEEKGYESITITDICRKANYNRATFYAHYKDKVDLASEMMEEKINGLLRFMSTPLPHNIQKQKNMVFDSIEQIFYYIEKQQAFFKIMFSGRTVPGFLGQLRHHFGKFFEKKMDSSIQEISPLFVNHEVLIDYITFSIIGVISYWVRSGMKRSPEYMSVQVSLILNQT